MARLVYAVYPGYYFSLTWAKVILQGGIDQAVGEGTGLASIHK